MVVIGFPMNLRDMLEDHRDLFLSKVKEIYYMDGYYNFGCAEHHFIGPQIGCNGASKYVVDNIPKSIP